MHLQLHVAPLVRIERVKPDGMRIGNHDMLLAWNHGRFRYRGKE
jgi:hypothetical protein